MTYRLGTMHPLVTTTDRRTHDDRRQQSLKYGRLKMGWMGHDSLKQNPLHTKLQIHLQIILARQPQGAYQNDSS